MYVENKGGIGNPYHDDLGRFTDKNGDGTNLDELFGVKSESDSKKSITFVPKTTSKNELRKWAKDMVLAEKAKYDEEMYKLVGDKLRRINENAKNPTILDNSYERILFRKKTISEEIESQTKESPKLYERKAIILLGLPASGKSSIANELLGPTGSFIIDADNMKEKIPEFIENDENICKVHEESVEMSNDMMYQIMQSGGNMIIGKVGGWFPDIEKIVLSLAKEGYQCDIVLNDLPYDITIERNMERYKNGKTKRIVPLPIIYDSDEEIFKTYDKLMEMKEVNGGAIYSNDVLYGQKPKLIATNKNAERIKI